MVLALLSISLLVSAARAPEPGRTISAVYNIIIWCFLVTALSLRWTRQDLDQLVHGVTRLAVLQGAVVITAIWVWPHGSNFRPLAAHVLPQRALDEPSVNAFLVNNLAFPDYYSGPVLRTSGFFGHPNWAAGLAGIAVLLIAGGVIGTRYEHWQRRYGWWCRSTSVLALVVAAAPLQYAYSRTTVVAVLFAAMVGALVLFTTLVPTRVWGSVYATCAVVAAAMATTVDWGGAYDRFNAPRLGSLVSRSDVYSQTWRAIIEMPVTVIGFGVKERVEGLAASLATHSTYLGMVYRAGWLAALALLLFLLAVFVTAVRRGQWMAATLVSFVALWALAEDLDVGHLMPLGLLLSVLLLTAGPAPRAPAQARARNSWTQGLLGDAILEAPAQHRVLAQRDARAFRALRRPGSSLPTQLAGRLRVARLNDLAPASRHGRFPAWMPPTFATLAAALLAAWNVGAPSLWFDETVSAYLANTDSHTFWEAVTSSEGNMSLYFLLLRLWPWNDTDTGLRALSVLFTAAAVPVTYQLAKELFNRRTAVLSGFLLATSCFALRFAQEARGYALLMLLATLTTLLMVQAVRSGGRGNWRWVLYALLVAAMAYVHLYAVFVLVPHVVYAGLCRRGRLALAVALVTAGAMTAPLALFVYGRRDAVQISFIPTPGLHEVGTVVHQFVGGNYALLLLVVLASVLACWRLPARYVHGLVLLLVAVLAPPVMSLVFSWLATPIFQSRYLISCLPPLLILVASGVATLDARWRQPLLAGGLLTMAVVTVPFTRGPLVQQDWRGAVTFIADGYRPGDVVLARPAFFAQPFDVYAKRAGLDVRLDPTVPADAAGATRIWLLGDTALPTDHPYVVVSEQTFTGGVAVRLVQR